MVTNASKWKGIPYNLPDTTEQDGGVINLPSKSNADFNTAGVINNQTQSQVVTNSESTSIENSASSENSTKQTLYTPIQAVQQSQQAIGQLGQPNYVDPVQVSYEGNTAVQNVLEGIRNVNLLSSLSDTDRQRLQNSIDTLGSGSNQIKMLAETPSDSRATANLLRDIYAATSKHGGINLLGASAVLASQRADRAERQRNVAQAELNLAQTQRALLSQDAQVRNNNSILPLNTESNLLINNNKLQQGYDFNNQDAVNKGQGFNANVDNNLTNSIINYSGDINRNNYVSSGNRNTNGQRNANELSTTNKILSGVDGQGKSLTRISSQVINLGE